MLKRAVATLGTPHSVSAVPAYVVSAIQSPWVLASIVLQATSYFVWLVVLSRMKLAVAVALSGAFFYVLMGIAAWQLFGESLGARQWLGIGFVAIGVLFMNWRLA